LPQVQVLDYAAVFGQNADGQEEGGWGMRCWFSRRSSAEGHKPRAVEGTRCYTLLYTCCGFPMLVRGIKGECV
jgi:hypothetical protein